MEKLSFTPSYEQKAFVGKTEVSRIDDFAEKILNQGILDKKDDSNEKAREILNEFTLKSDSVKKLEETLVNSSSSEKQIASAEENLDILSKSVFWVMVNGIDEQRDLMGRGSASEINEYLPKAMEGLGERIVKNIYKSETVVETLRELDEDREFYDLDLERDKKTYSDKIVQAIEKLRGMNIEERKKHKEEILMVSAYLNTEVQRLTESVDKQNKFKQKREKKEDEYVERPVKDEDSNTLKKESYTRAWELDPDHMAEAMLNMDPDMRWSDSTPPEWFKKMEIKDPELAYHVSVMAMIHNAATSMSFAGKNLDKIVGNPNIFSFKNIWMSKLFNEDFKMATSKMLNDLCEVYTDYNGRPALRYKEGWREDKQYDEYGNVKLKPDGEIDYKRYWSIEKGVVEKIRHVRTYEMELANFLAEKHGRFKVVNGKFELDDKGNKKPDPNWEDKMNGATAWNMFYGFGDSSLADRMRVLPTFTGVINDGVRTLNPEYKALAKWQILKSGQVKKDENLFDAEYFTGNLADYVLKVLKLERDLGHNEIIDKKEVHVGEPIDGKKTLRQKILDGDMAILSNKMMYGFFDFVHGGRDLYRGEFIDPEDQTDTHKPVNFYEKDKHQGEKVTLATLVMNYGKYVGEDKNKKFVKNENAMEFNFGNAEVTFMNEYLDMMDAATVVYNSITGKADAKNPMVWARNLKDKLGMVNGIEINGERALSYSRKPDIWRDCIIGSFGADETKLSSDYIPLRKPVTKSGVELHYSKYVYGLLTDVFKLSNTDLNISEVMRLLGVKIEPGQNPWSLEVEKKTDWLEFKDKLRTVNLSAKQEKKFEYGMQNESVLDYVDRVKGATQHPNNEDFKSLMKAFDRAVKSGDEATIERLANAIEKFNPKK